MKERYDWTWHGFGVEINWGLYSLWMTEKFSFHVNPKRRLILITLFGRTKAWWL